MGAHSRAVRRLALVGFFALTTPAIAETSTINAADTAWMIVATALVLMMTIPGLALFYAGMVRKKNVLATMAQSLASVMLVSILWVAYGYSLAFVGDGSWIGTLDRWFLAGMTMESVNPAAKTIPEALFMLYQMTFAIITVALVAGAVADRMRFTAWLWFSVGWFTFVYVPLAHWVWGGGFLATMGVLDFAGGLVVHLSAGIGGLVAAKVMGNRHGYGSENLAPYDLALAVIGTGMLWVGWFGFNGGSALTASPRAVMASDASFGVRRRADLGGAGMVDAEKAFGARHDLRRRGRSRHHYAGLRLCRAMGRHPHWRRRGRDLLLGLHLAEAAPQLRRFARRVRRAWYRRHDGHAAVRRVRGQGDRRHGGPA
jgi:Ammonium Transporter Family